MEGKCLIVVVVGPNLTFHSVGDNCGHLERILPGGECGAGAKKRTHPKISRGSLKMPWVRAWLRASSLMNQIGQNRIQFK